MALVLGSLAAFILASLIVLPSASMGAAAKHKASQGTISSPKATIMLSGADPRITQFTVVPSDHPRTGLKADSLGSSLVSLGGRIWFIDEGGRTAGNSSLPSLIGSITPSGQVTTFPIPDPNFDSDGTATIIAGADGNIWFDEASGGGTGGPTIGRLTPQGQVTIFRASEAVNNLVAGSDGNIWFTEGGSASASPDQALTIPEVGRLTPSGALSEFPIPSLFGYAWASPGPLIAGAGGVLFATSSQYSYAGMVAKVTPSGEISGTLFGPSPSNINVDSMVAAPDGSTWLLQTGSGTSEVGRISPTGTVSEFPTNPWTPDAIAVGPDGQIWVTGASSQGNTGVLSRISPSGQITNFNPNATGYGGASIAGRGGDLIASPDGNLWMDECGGIGQVSPQGQVAWLLTESCPTGTSALTVGPDGNIWAIVGNQIWRVNLHPDSFGRCSLRASAHQPQIARSGYLVVKVRCNQPSSLSFSDSLTTRGGIYGSQRTIIWSLASPSGLHVPAGKSVDVRIKLHDSGPFRAALRSGARATAYFQATATVGDQATTAVAQISRVRY